MNVTRFFTRVLPTLLAAALCLPAAALEKPDFTGKIFQFPPDKIPCIDGQTDDWAIVPESYAVGSDQLRDDRGTVHPAPAPQDLSMRVRVGWVKGLNRLYFLYEASDNYWCFGRPDLVNDTFELVVDGDLSGGPFIERFHPDKQNAGPRNAFFEFHGVHAQNYHIFTPALNKDWAMAWGCQPWIKELPYANHAASYSFKPGEGGQYVLEFWITPFDYAGAEGPGRAVESRLFENKKIGLCWAVIDYDNAVSTTSHAFWNLSPKHTMYGQASEMLAFQLMPLEARFQKPIQAQWSFKVLDMDRRLVAFQDESEGQVTSWKWDFGDGTTSAERHPLHTYAKTGDYIVILDVEGPRGKSRLSKIWDVTLR